MKHARWLRCWAYSAIVGSAVALAALSNAASGQEKLTLEEEKKVRELQLKLKRIQGAIEALEASSSTTAAAKADAQNVVNSAVQASTDARKVEEDAATAATIIRTSPAGGVAVRANAAVEPDDGLERLRRNQRALTDQRIGDIIILRGNQ